MIQPWRGKRIGAAHLHRASLPLALVSVAVDPPGRGVADLCDPVVLSRLDIQPDRSASRLRETTQPLARRVWGDGFAGLRWWSSFWGDWHTVVLFTARMEERTSFGAPEPLELGHPAVSRAAELLGVELVD